MTDDFAASVSNRFHELCVCVGHLTQTYDHAESGHRRCCSDRRCSGTGRLATTWKPSEPVKTATAAVLKLKPAKYYTKTASDCTFLTDTLNWASRHSVSYCFSSCSQKTMHVYAMIINEKSVLWRLTPTIVFVLCNLWIMVDCLNLEFTSYRHFEYDQRTTQYTPLKL